MRPALLLALCAAAAAPACGRPSAGDAGPPAWFVERARDAGIDFTFHTGHTAHPDRFCMPEIIGGGGALFDMDGDGDLDASLPPGGDLAGAEPAGGDQLFRNDGRARFTDATRASGIDERRYGMGVACGDVDEDGDTDLYVTNVGRCTLLVNAG